MASVAIRIIEGACGLSIEAKVGYTAKGQESINAKPQKLLAINRRTPAWVTGRDETGGRVVLVLVWNEEFRFRTIRKGRANRISGTREMKRVQKAIPSAGSPFSERRIVGPDFSSAV